MYFNVVGDGVTELYKTAYKVVPVNVVESEFSVPEEHPLKDIMFEKYDHCFNFIKDFYENMDKFFAEDGFNWDKKAFEGLDHFDIIHVVYKNNELGDNNAIVPVLSETVASVRVAEEYPFSVPEEEPVEEPVEETPTEMQISVDDELEQIRVRMALLERLILTPDIKEKEAIVKQMGYHIVEPEATTAE